MQAGQRVGKYVLGERIAHGGMAEVWAAQVEGPGGFVKPLALKFIRESFAGDSELERLFVNEARLAARLQHANLVGVFDFDRLGEREAGAPGRYYIAMERVEGQDLRRVMQAAWHKGHRIPVPVALYLAGEVLKGLRYVHERRDEAGGKALELVHRDVSPHNVLVGLDGDVKLSDFGIAKARALTGNVQTQAGTVRGKLAYAAPEQLRAEPLDHRADQFALGVILWELLAQRRLFDGASEKAIVDKVLGGDIPALPADAGVDAAVERLTRRMLSLRPADRFPSTADALNAVLTVPGYSPDARPLVDLMRTLLAPQLAPVPRTVPLDLADPPPVRGPAAGAQAPTVALERPLFGDTTGSSYVSDRSSALRAYGRPPGSRALRLVVVASAVAVAAVGTGVGLRRLAARTTSVAKQPPASQVAAAPPPVVAPPVTVEPPESPAPMQMPPAPPPLVTVESEPPTAPSPIDLLRPKGLAVPSRALEIPVVAPAAASAPEPTLTPAPAPSRPPAPSVPTSKSHKGTAPNDAPILE